MDTEFWLARWRKGEIGFHQSAVEPALVRELSGLAPTRVFVPLCGKSLDLAWLAEQGHEVVGVELSAEACEAFFAEQKLEASKTAMGPFTVYRAGRITIFNGDLFALEPEQLGSIGAVYDRAALIALPPELRPRYAAHLGELIGGAAHREDFRFVLVVLERTPTDDSGPPFSVSAAEIESLYGARFEVALQSRAPAAARAPEGAVSEQAVYRLRAR